MKRYNLNQVREWKNLLWFNRQLGAPRECCLPIAELTSDKIGSWKSRRLKGARKDARVLWIATEEAVRDLFA